MPTISTPSKISGTQAYTEHVLFSGSTSQEREAKVAEVIGDTGAILVPPYDHPDIMLGQGTASLELHQKYEAKYPGESSRLRAVIAPCGGVVSSPVLVSTFPTSLIYSSLALNHRIKGVTMPSWVSTQILRSGSLL